MSRHYGQLLEDNEVESVQKEDGLKMKMDDTLTYVMLDGSMIFTREEGAGKKSKLGVFFKPTR